MDDALRELINNRLDPALAGTPYPNDEAFHTDVLAAVSLHLVAGVMLVWDDDDPEPLGGAAMDEETAVSYLLDYPVSKAGAQPELCQMIKACRAYIGTRVKAGGADLVPRLERLRRALGLPDFAVFCLACALSAGLDRGFERLFVALHGDTQTLCPTLGVTESLYALARPVTESCRRELLSPGSATNRLLLKPVPEGKPYALRPLALRDYAEEYLVCGDGTGGLLALGCSLLQPGGELDGPLFLEKQEERVSAAVRLMTAREQSLLLVLCGPDGAGRKSTLRSASRQTGARFLLIPRREWGDALDQWTGCIAFCALLHGLIPCFTPGDRPEEYGPVRKALAALSRYHVGAVLLVHEQRAVFPPDERTVIRVEYPLPDPAQSFVLWRHYGKLLGIEADYNTLAAKYRLPPGRIRSALEAARLMAVKEVAAADIDAAVLAGNTGRLGEIADRIDIRYTWKDLVLGEAAYGRLRTVCNRIRNRHTVEEQLGVFSKGGVSVLLYGPPGTGKTMSAQVIAGELGLPMYRINLAQIISKYIGETAKNLHAVFAEAKSSNVVLFFDEADALFAKRTEVKDSNDRHANSESAYLLQEIEEYHGVSILATNLVNNFDEAFRRRIQYLINIGLPDEAQRLRLWENTLPERLRAAGVDLKLLARELEFSGSVIVSAATQAVYFAAEDGAKVGMNHLAHAIQLELQKLGKGIPACITALAAKPAEKI